MPYSPAATIAADLGIRDAFSMDVVSRLAAAVHTAITRSKARKAYRQMLECEDHVLRDIGVTRAEIRQALRECGGRS